MSFFILIFLSTAWAERGPLSLIDDRSVGAVVSDGYISSISEDSVEPMRELILLTPPPELRTAGSEKIFTSALQKEFRTRYREEFGFTYAQQFLNDPVDVSFYGFARGYSVEEEKFRAKKRGFGEYVAKKTVEYHVDNYFKSDPQLKPVYEAKERLSNLDVKVDEQTKVNSNYDFAGNHITTSFERPNMNARIRWELQGDTTVSFYRTFTASTNGEIFYKFNDRKYTAIGRKRLSNSVETSLTVQVNDRETAERPKENLLLLSLSVSN